MSLKDIADDMERWASAERGAMVRSTTAEREVREWALLLRAALAQRARQKQTGAGLVNTWTANSSALITLRWFT